MSICSQNSTLDITFKHTTFHSELAFALNICFAWYRSKIRTNWFPLVTFWCFWVILDTAKMVGVHFLIFWYFFSMAISPHNHKLKSDSGDPKSCNQITQNHHFGPTFLSFWVSRRIFTFGYWMWGSYQWYIDNMGSFCDFGWVQDRACHI